MRHARSSRAVLVAAISVLAPLAAFGCEPTVDGLSAPRSLLGDTVATKALELATAGSNAYRLNAKTPATYAIDPVVGAAHGSLLLPGGSTAAATPALARMVQHYYLERLLGEAGPTVRAEFETKPRPAEGDPGELVDNALLIAWLIDQVQPPDASDLKSVNKFIAKSLGGGALPAELGLVAGDRASRESYNNRCSDALVPIPPDWNPSDPANKWKMQPAPLTPVFIGAESTSATVWYHESEDDAKPGACIALARADANDVITSLGVICQGNAGDAACFWDSTRDIQPTENVAILSDGFNAGPDLDGGVGGKCTDCHRGANAFITHPGSSLQLETSAPFSQSFWVRPIVHGDWYQNANEGLELQTIDPDRATIERSGEDTCIRCHQVARVGGSFPELGGKHSKYCDFVITNAILPGPKQTMPMEGTSLMFRFDEETIALACGWDVSVLRFPPRAPVTDQDASTDPAL